MPYMSVVRKDNLELIVKVNRDLHEQNILEYLHSEEQRSDHVIQLEGTCLSNLGPGILLPIRQPVRELMSNSKGQLGQFRRFAEDLISGLQFLHSNLVAHRDIKPDNLVYSPEFGLQIIDFDVAVQLDKDTDMVDDVVGTEGYMAPELEDNQGLSYSPLKADLWSCGWVIKEFLGCMREGELYKKLKQLASELTADNPRKRPPLDSWRWDGSMQEMPARKRARVEDKRVPNVRCATAQMASSPVGMYEYTEINMVGVFAGL